jgi:CheY-like chemotaxis protein
MTPPVGPSKTVVIADDTAFVRDRFRSVLEEAGHQAITVRSAVELLARVRADLDRLDLVVLDLRLPNAAGIELVRGIRRLDDGRLPIVVFSGTIASADEVRELASLGVAGYVNEYSATQHILPSLAPHLFPDTFNRRSSPRVVLGIPVAYRYGNTIAAALTLNLGRGGLAIRTTSPLEPGAPRACGSGCPAEARDRGGGARALERPPRGHGTPVRARRARGRTGHPRLRRRALLQQPQSLTALAAPVRLR